LSTCRRPWGRARRIALLTPAILLAALAAGCETTPPAARAQSCRVTDWYLYGLNDGRLGVLASERVDLFSDCAAIGAPADIAAYESGRAEGLVEYCTAESGYEAGYRGRRNRNVCPPGLATGFLQGYEQGARDRSLFYDFPPGWWYGWDYPYYLYPRYRPHHHDHDHDNDHDDGDDGDNGGDDGGGGFLKPIKKPDSDGSGSFLKPVKTPDSDSSDAATSSTRSGSDRSSGDRSDRSDRGGSFLERVDRDSDRSSRDRDSSDDDHDTDGGGVGGGGGGGGGGDDSSDQKLFD
jgi:hypothetical protein